MFPKTEINYSFNFSYINILAVPTIFYHLLLHTTKKIIKIYVQDSSQNC